MKGLRRHKRRFGLLCGPLYTKEHKPIKSTVITIEDGERTPLLKGNNNDYGGVNSPTATKVNKSYGDDQCGEDSTYGSESDRYSLKERGDESTKIGMSPEKQPIDCCSCLQIITFVLLLASACFIAAYLLINESRLPPIKYSLDLVHRHIWTNVTLPIADLLNHSQVINIVITQTGGSSCNKFNKCLQILRNLQKQYQGDHHASQEVPFNFLIDGNKQTYEARGWNYASDLPFVAQNVSLVIALMGNYTTLAPNTVQLRSILSLIAESLRRKKLQNHYKIYGLQNSTKHQNDGKALFDVISRWKHFNGLLQLQKYL